MPGLANDLNISQPGLVVHNGSGVFTGVTLTAGTGISISNGNGISGNPTISSLIGSVVTANATPQFVLAGTVDTLDFGLTNLILGSSSSSITSAARNVGFGLTNLNPITSGTDNTAIGYNALKSVTTSSLNTAVGAFSQQTISTGATGNTSIGYATLSNNTGANNTALGYSSLGSCSTGTNNTGVGSGALGSVATGTYNIGIGPNLFNGSSLTTTDSSNINIGNPGIVGDNNTIRIGTSGTGSGQQNKTLIAGITGVTAAGSPVAVSSTGQLSDLGFGTATNILTSNGAGNSPTWQAAAAPAATGFFAYASSAKSNVTGNSVIYTVLFDSTTRNNGTAYATGTGLYTAPSTGLYHFSTTIIFTSGSTFTAGSELVVSSIGSVSSQILEQVGAATSAIGSTVQILSSSWELQMTAGDTVGVRVLSTSTLQDVSIGGSALSPNQFTAISSFSGFKVGT